MPRRLEFLSTTAVRWLLRSVAAFAVALILIFGLIYWQTTGQLTGEMDNLLIPISRVIATESDSELLLRIQENLRNDPRQVKTEGVFDKDGRILAGNFAAIPGGLHPLGQPKTVPIERIGLHGVHETETARAIAQMLPDGRLLVLARDMEQVKDLTKAVARTLALCAILALLLAIAAGVLASFGTVRRIEAMHAASHRIMSGQLAERLPISRSKDDFDKLAGIVNIMLDEIERLMSEVKGAGDAIAHDLRTPLGRLRGRLERARDDPSRSADELRADIDGAIGQLNEVVNTMQALLRIGEIEHGRRKEAFAAVDIAETARDIAELYAPLAEDKNLSFDVLAADAAPVLGDRQLLFEMLTNLVDNAIKFAPLHGHVQLRVAHEAEGISISVADDGPGIPPDERNAVLRRFYRSDQSRHTRGTGLGFSLVAAIVRLHGFRMAIEDGPGNRGCRVIVRWEFGTY